MSSKQCNRFISEKDCSSYLCGIRDTPIWHKTPDGSNKYIGICDSCGLYTCNSLHEVEEDCGNYCDKCDTLICGKCMKNDPRKYIFVSANTMYNQNFLEDYTCCLCSNCIIKYTNVSEEDGIDINGKCYYTGTIILCLQDALKKYFSHIEEKDKEIAELKLEIAHLKYKPDGEGAKEAQKHFKKLASKTEDSGII